MKKFILFLVLFVLTCSSANARERSIEKLKEIAASFINMQKSGKPRKAKAIPSEMRMAVQKEQLAVLANDDFFVVLAIDDDIEPVLGYSETDINESSMPPGFQWWLNAMNESLEKGDRKEMARRAGVPAGLPTYVEPLITTKWWQREPYNNKCPLGKMKNDNTFSRCVTGCVATAMAQIMNYHEYPLRGTGSHGYETTGLIKVGDYEGHYLFKDFSETSFDWAHMKDDYSSGYTEAEADAVAELMLACGISVNMEYTPKASAAQMYDADDAFEKYFGYGSTLHVKKSNYTEQKWMNRIYFNLKRHLPILYAGKDLRKNVSHAFVVDGYDSSGNIHINWGHAGYCNGYFYINNLVDNSYVIINNNSNDSFNYSGNQEMICEIMPQTRSFEVKEINVSQPGTLSSLLPESEYDFIEALKVSGDINGSDITVLKKLCKGEETNYILHSLDLSDVNIVEGGDSSCYTSNDELPENSFYRCRGLYRIILPHSIKSIGQQAFCYCDKLISIDIPENVSSIGNSAFFDTPWYDNQPNGLLYVGRVAYHYIGTMPEESEIVIKDGIKTIANSAFYNCKGLTSITIPESVTRIGKNVFENCSSLSSVHIKDIGAWCNISCDERNSLNKLYTSSLYLNGQEIEDLVIPNGVTSIGAYSFYGCGNMTSLTIPNSVTSIGDQAFRSGNVKTVLCLNTSVPETLGNNTFEIIYGYATLYVPASALDDYRNATPWKYFGTIHAVDSLSPVIVDGIKYELDVMERTATVIANESNESNYTGSIVIPASINVNGLKCNVTSISNNAFCDSKYLTSVTIPEGVTSIGARAFFGCSWLSSVSIPQSVISIGPFAFAYCYELRSITIPEGVENIGKSAFCSCQRMAYAIIPSSVTSIGDRAFEFCRGLNAVFCLGRNDVPETGSNVFAQSSCGTATLYVPNSLLSRYSNTEPWNVFGEIKTWNDLSIDGLGYHLDVMARTASVYGGTGYVGNVIIPASVDVSGLPFDVTGFGWPFSFCGGLITVTIPGSIRVIGNQAFYSCSNLRSVTISEGVERIGNQAFAGCSRLTSVTIPKGVWSIGAQAFADCSRLTSVTIPKSVWSIGFGAFSNCDGLREIYCLAEEVPNVDQFTFQNVPVRKVMLVVPDDAVEQYKAHPIWRQFFIETVTGIKALPDSPGKGADIYSLGGSRIPVLQKGINIKGGRKILVK